MAASSHSLSKAASKAWLRLPAAAVLVFLMATAVYATDQSACLPVSIATTALDLRTTARTGGATAPTNNTTRYQPRWHGNCCNEPPKKTATVPPSQRSDHRTHSPTWSAWHQPSHNSHTAVLARLDLPNDRRLPPSPLPATKVSAAAAQQY